MYNAEEKYFENFYAANPDPESRLQAFAVRQVAARMLGCLGYLCATVGAVEAHAASVGSS